MKRYIKSAIGSLSDEDLDARKEVARSGVSEQYTDQLISDSNQYVRVEVAKNPNTSPELLTKLANDRSNKVKIAVAGNPNTPPEVLCKIRNNMGDFYGEGQSYYANDSLGLGFDRRYIEALLKNNSTPIEYRKKIIDYVYERRHLYPKEYQFIDLLKKLVGSKKTSKELVNYIESSEIELLRYWRQKAPELYLEDYLSPILVALGYAEA